MLIFEWQFCRFGYFLRFQLSSDGFLTGCGSKLLFRGLSRGGGLVAIYKIRALVQPPRGSGVVEFYMGPLGLC